MLTICRVTMGTSSLPLVSILDVKPPSLVGKENISCYDAAFWRAVALLGTLVLCHHMVLSLW